MRKIHSIVIALLLSTVCLGQTLPSLPKASEVETGVLPNGISYYVISNPASNGRTDYALVQRGQYGNNQTRAKLVKLPRLSGSVPYRFFAGNGSGYTSDGYVTSSSEATIYRFKDFYSSNTAATDTTLMTIFDISASYPYEQALVVCGDITASSFVEKVKMFAMMVTSRAEYYSRYRYEWEPSDEAAYDSDVNLWHNVASVSVTYSAQRTPDEYLPTVQPLVTEKLAAEMGDIVKSRVREEFAVAGIPLAGVQVTHTDSSQSNGDELYTITIYTDQSMLRAATSKIAAILSELDARGATQADFMNARDNFNAVARRKSMTHASNEEYVDHCINVYLHGGSLASRKSVGDYFLSRSLPVDKELPLLNDFMSALFDKKANLSLYYSSPSDNFSEKDMLSTFEASWDLAHRAVWVDKKGRAAADTLHMVKPTGKAKIKTETKEPLSGGDMWTFSNGMKVIYKKAATGGLMHFSFVFNGGNESPFTADVLGFYSTAGMDSKSFNTMLSTNGIDIKTSVSLTDMRIQGSAPSSSLTLLLKSMLTLSKERSFDKDAYKQYREAEALRLEMASSTPEGHLARIDALMRQTEYTPFKTAYGLKSYDPADADKYFTRQFSKFNDGIWILVGDMDPLAVKKILTSYVGSFPVSAAIAPRPQVKYQLASTPQTITEQSYASPYSAGRKGMEVALSALTPVSSGKFMAFQLASILLQNELVKYLTEYGVTVNVDTDVEVFPSDRLSVLLSFMQAERTGLPEGVAPASPAVTMSVTEAVLQKFADSGFSEGAIKEAKALLLKRLDYEMSRPEGVISALMLRYSDNRDYMADYKSKVAAVSSSAVKDVVATLVTGCRINYIFE